MKQNWKQKCRRVMSGFLAFTMTSILALGDAGTALASEGRRFFQEGSELGGESYSKATSSNASFKNRKIDDVVMSVFSSSESDFRAGGTVFLDVHIKNETDSVITEGTLDFNNRKLKESGAYFEQPEEDAITEGWPEVDREEESDLDFGYLVSDLENDLAENNEWEYGNFDETEEDAGKDEPLQKLEGIELYPGQVYTARFVFDIDDDIEKAKNKNVKFRFRGRNEEGRIHRQEEFQYTVNYVNVDQVRFEDGNEVKTGEIVTMGIHASMYNFDGILSNKKVEEELLASISNAQKATDSNSGAATPSNMDTEEDEEALEESGDDEDNDTFVVDLGDTSYEIQMINAKLNGFEVREALVDDANENMMICSFRISKDVKPGIYFGKIIQKSKEKHRAYYSTQGFSLIVSGEGDVTLESKVQGSDATVIVTGAASAFPEADQLAVSAREISMDEIDDNGQRERIQAAMARKAREEGIDIKAFKAMDITLYADGEEIHQMSDDIRVIFQNVEAKDILENIVEGPVQEASGEEYGGARYMLQAAGIRMEDNIQTMSLNGGEDQSGDGQQEKVMEDPGEEVVGQDVKTEDEWLASLYAELGIMSSSGTDTAAGAESTEAVQIWYLDEDSQELSEMETVLEGDGSATMTTDHFSTYIWVNLSKITGSIKVTIEHYGKDIKTVDGTAKASTGTDSVFKKNGNTGVVKQKTSSPKIYSTDSYTIPNQYYNVNINKLSKVLNVSGTHYTVDHIEVTPSGETKKTYYYKSGNYYTNAACTKKLEGLNLTKNTKIRFYYRTTTGNLANNVTFYDYNITNGKRYNADKKEASNGNYLYTSKKKINSDSSFASNTAETTKKKLGVGQPDSGNMSPWADTARYNKTGKYLNQGNNNGKGVVGNIVTGLNKEGGLEFNNKVNESKYLFTANGSTSKKFTGNLNFKRTGDTYILSSVSGGAGNSKLSARDLDSIKGYAGNAVYSNNFWPLDNVKYDGKDPNMGGDTTFHCLDGDKRSISASDDGKAHNWHFGMKYSFKFKVGDYVGPMEYYFRGDDDFWLFIDGKKAIDIGGIHVAMGETLDVKQWLIDNGKLSEKPTAAQKAAEHTVTIYYMERGGFGSCCYMQFTLPNSEPIVPPDIPTTSYTVEKKWKDYDNPYRPDSIKVELYQKEGNKNQATGETAILNKANGWKHTWNELPKKNGKSGVTYVYTAKEVVPKGYIASGNGISTGSATSGSITNTLDGVKVKVTKEWKNDSQEVRPASVQFQLLNNNGTPYKDGAGNTKIITLSKSNSWTGDFTNLPKVDKKGTALSYKVKELTALSGYTSSSPTNVTLTEAQKNSGYQSHWKVVNTYASSEIFVEKIWDDTTPESEKFEVTVGLYQMTGNQPVAVAGQTTRKLNSTNQWKESWTGLKQYDDSGQPITYRPYEMRDGKILEEGARIPGKNGYFTVSYNASHNEITNVYHPEQVKVKIRKEWVGDTPANRPNEVKFQLLYADGSIYHDSDGKEYILVLNAGKDWSGEFVNLPKVDGQGKTLAYTVKEISEVKGYRSSEAERVSLTSTEKNQGYESSWKIVNTFSDGETTVSVEKIWDEGTPDREKSKVYVALYRIEGNTVVRAEKEEKVLTIQNNWKTEWTKLKKYDDKGELIQYRPYEMDKGERAEPGMAVENGKFLVSYNEDHTQITNTYNYENLTVKKIWQDYENAYNSRPEKLKVRLLQNGKQYQEQEITVDAEGNWVHTWTNIPKMKDKNTSYVYTVVEMDEDGKEVAEDQEGNFNGYLYKVSYDMNSDSADGTVKKPFVIANKIKPAYLRLRKLVTSDEEAPFIPDYKFLLRLREKESKEFHTIVALGDEETSGSILLILPAKGKEFVIDEIVPMEYEIDGYVMENRAENDFDDRQNEGTEERPGEIRVYPGDDIIFTIKNKHSHEGYFHHTTSVTNQYETGKGFGPRNPYSEKPNKEKTDRPVQKTVVEETVALWPDRVEEKEEDDVRLV